MNTLNYSMGDEADDILASLKLTNEDRAFYRTVQEQLDNLFIVKRTAVNESVKLNMKVQRVI